MNRLLRSLGVAVALWAGVCASAQAQSVSGLLTYSYNSYLHQSGANSTVVKSSAGLLRALVINIQVAGCTFNIYDGVSAGGVLLASITVGASPGPTPVAVTYDAATVNGIFIVTTGTCDYTVLYR